MEEIIERGTAALENAEKLSKFHSQYGFTPIDKAKETLEEIESVASAITGTEEPQTHEELHLNEMKRRLNGETSNFTNWLSGRRYCFEDIVRLYAIPPEDIEQLKPWLLTNRQKTLEAMSQLFETRNVESYNLGLPADIPRIRRQAEEFAAIHIIRYHKSIGKLLEKLTKVAQYIRDIDAETTTDSRSYFNPFNNRFAIGIKAICYTTEKDDLKINEQELLRLYGHEGMGHALNQLITRASTLPKFLREQSSITRSTAESVAQYYERQIFEDLKDSPETQKELAIHHIFQEIYDEVVNTGILQEYSRRLFQYAITVLADKTLGEPQDPQTIKKKKERINEVALTPGYAGRIVEDHRYAFDSEGNLNFTPADEIKYCAKPVERALQVFEQHGLNYETDRSTLDAALLTGLWTPIGYVERAKIIATSTPHQPS